MILLNDRIIEIENSSDPIHFREPEPSDPKRKTGAVLWEGPQVK